MRSACILMAGTAREFKITFESPKKEDLSLFTHGELAYEHVILAPPKSKGKVI
jgi:oligosaccharyltransferase complex subunit beta